MEKTKAIVLLVVASVLLITVVGIAYASAQTNAANNSTSQTPQGINGNSYPYSQQGNYPHGSQNTYPYGYGRGRACVVAYGK